MTLSKPTSRSAIRFSSPSSLPYVSVIVAVRNEEAHIAHCLEQLFSQDYSPDRLEIVVADGMSNDRTREIAEGIPRNGIPLRVLLNRERGRAQGLNLAIQAAKGEVIVRVDARTVIGKDYLARCVNALLRVGAENVGGVQKPIAKTFTQQAIGLALAHPFGVGNAEFRLGTKSGFVDSVYLGCFRREVFERVGLFDEDASVISEDSDINYRIRQTGGKVYLDKSIVASYCPRETIRELWRLYFRYGGARAGNLLKHKRLTSWRQVVAPMFLMSLVLLPLLGLADFRFMLLFSGVLGMYVLLSFSVALRLTIQEHKPALFHRLLVVFPCMHFAWALGFWKRLLVPDHPGTYWGH